MAIEMTNTILGTNGRPATAGEADVLPYPSRREMLLRDRFHDRMIDVHQRRLSQRQIQV